MHIIRKLTKIVWRQEGTGTAPRAKPQESTEAVAVTLLQELRRNDSLLPAPERLAVAREIARLSFPPESHLRKLAEENRGDSHEAVNHLIDGVTFLLPRYGSLAALRTPLEEKKDEALTTREQWGSLLLGLYLAAVLVGALIVLKYRSARWDQSAGELFLLGLFGGLFGGAARALFMWHRELGGHAEKPASHYLKGWCFFLIKPVIGVGSGTLFVVATVFGVGQIVTSNSPTIEFMPTFLIAAIGGIFFEEVLGVLHNIVRALSPERESRGAK
ncbi:MAG: hypothetical protein ACREM3_16735 [Candidatus Rokuibacteriota bacterium]